MRRDRAQTGGLKFEADVVHEFYHVLQFAHTTSYSRVVPTDVGVLVQGSWFTEALAKWAEWAYVPESSSTEVENWYPAIYDDDLEMFLPSFYQPGDLSLLETGNKHEYASYIWPYFMQQELGGLGATGKVGNAWKAADFANGPEAIDRAVNTQLPFTDHFRDFIVRNLNNVFPDDPLKIHFWDLDTSGFRRVAHPVVDNLDDQYRPITLENNTLRMPIDFEIYNLAAGYWNFKVPASSGIQHVLFEFEADEPDALDAESVAEVVNMAGDNYWKRFSSPDGRRLEFCLADPEKNVDQIILALGNHSFTRSGTSIIPPATKGKMYVSTAANCGEWTGTLTYTLKNLYREETVSDLGTTVRQDREIMTQSWAVTKTGTDPNLPMLQQLTLSWLATDEVLDTEDLDPVVPCGGNTLHMSTNGTRVLTGTLNFDVSYGPNGAIILGDVTPLPGPTLDWAPAFDQVSCDGYEVTGNGNTRTISDQYNFAFGTYGPLTGFTPDPNDPTYYHGSNTVTVAPNVTATVTWDLHHHPNQ